MTVRSIRQPSFVQSSLALACLCLSLSVLDGCGKDKASPNTKAKDAAAAADEDAGPQPLTKQTCLAMAQAGDGGLTTEGSCACDMCLQELSDCTADQGCTEIYACTRSTGCRGINDCYLGQALCRTEIDKWGATSLSATLSQQLGDCMTMKGCSTAAPASCSVVGDFSCDGNEDCPSGQQCCGRFGGGAYDHSQCAASCEALSSDAGAANGGIWSNMCHPGDSCTTSGYTCSSSAMYLPDFLFRCRDTGTKPTKTGSTKAGEVNCGSSVCGAGQKCCVRTPMPPYCAAQSETCECNHTPGMPSKDAGTDAAMSIADDAGNPADGG